MSKRAEKLHDTSMTYAKCINRKTKKSLVVTILEHPLYYLVYILLCILLTQTSIADIVFERVKPVVWLATKSKVNLGVANYDINFAYTDPCKVFGKYIENNLVPGENITEDQRNSLRSFETHCRALYVLEWKKEVDQLLEVKLPNHPLEAPVDRPYSEPNIIVRQRRDLKQSYNNKLKYFNLKLDSAFKRLPKWKNQKCTSNSNDTEPRIMNTSEVVARMTKLEKVLSLMYKKAGGDDFFRFIDMILSRYDNHKKAKPLSKRELLIRELERLKEMEFFHRYFETITCEECALAKVAEITEIEKISKKIRDTYQPNEFGDALEHMQRSQKAGLCELHTRQLGRLIYASNDDRFEVDSIRLRRNLEVLTTDNFEKEGTEPAEKKYTFWRVMGQIFLGPFAPLASLFEETPRETQLYKQAGRIATLYKRVK